MKETKFRVWDNDKKMYLDEYNCYKKNICIEGEKINSIDNIWLGLDGSVWYEWHDGYELQNQKANAILEQYTVLKDKNGVEVYEGDVINYQRIEFIVEILKGTTIAYREKATANLISYQIEKSEVIGNVHTESD